ncbi:MAG: hypothetical protein RL338_1653 [Chloroflexota bacterium]
MTGPSDGGRIESPRNERLRAVLALRDRAGRDAAGLTLVDGLREIRRALEAGADLRQLLQREGPASVKTRKDTEDDREAILRLARSARIPVTPVAPAAYGRIAYGDRDDGLVAVVAIPPSELGSLRPGPAPLLLVADGIEKPGNLGAIVRSADGAGADGVIATNSVGDLYNPNAIRASVGSIFRLRPVAATPVEAIEWCRARGIRLVAARVDGATDHTAADLTGPLAIVVGSEALGLGGAWDDPGVARVRIPMLGIGDSLNVSVAAAILLYEARRQRGTVG